MDVLIPLQEACHEMAAQPCAARSKRMRVAITVQTIKTIQGLNQLFQEQDEDDPGNECDGHRAFFAVTLYCGHNFRIRFVLKTEMRCVHPPWAVSTSRSSSTQ